MNLPRLQLEIKLLIFFLFVALLPLVLMNLLFLNHFLSLILADLNKMIVSLALLVITLLFIVLLTVWISQHIVDPIKQIHIAFREAGLGNLSKRLSVHTGDEIEDLANGFNAMVDNLQKSIASLQREREIISAERNKFAIVLSGITDPVIAVDLNRTIVIFNNAAEELIGISASDAIGKPLEGVMKIFHEGTEIPSSHYCPIRTDDFEGVVFNKKELKLVGQNGKEAYVNIIVGKIKEAVSIHLGCILAIHDKTTEKSLEEMKLDFVSMAAHELRTPLTSLKGYLSVFIEDNKAMFNDEQMMFLNRINISASQLTNLVENLLSVSRIERGAFSVRTEALDWIELVGKAIEDLMDRAKDRRIELTFTRPMHVISKLSVDRLRIDEVLTNLLSNAIAYTQPGGKVTVSIEEKDREVITHIQDTGQGIPKDAIPHLFTKFFRVSGALEAGSKGTGLGLYISKAIIAMHNGKIWVESELGKGSTFSFSLPALPAQQSYIKENGYEALSHTHIHG